MPYSSACTTAYFVRLENLAIGADYKVQGGLVRLASGGGTAENGHRVCRRRLEHSSLA